MGYRGGTSLRRGVITAKAAIMLGEVMPLMMRKYASSCGAIFASTKHFLDRGNTPRPLTLFGRHRSIEAPCPANSVGFLQPSYTRQRFVKSSIQPNLTGGKHYLG